MRQVDLESAYCVRADWLNGVWADWLNGFYLILLFFFLSGCLSSWGEPETTFSFLLLLYPLALYSRLPSGTIGIFYEANRQCPDWATQDNGYPARETW